MKKVLYENFKYFFFRIFILLSISIHFFVFFFYKPGFFFICINYQKEKTERILILHDLLKKKKSLIRKLEALKRQKYDLLEEMSVEFLGDFYLKDDNVKIESID